MARPPRRPETEIEKLRRQSFLTDAQDNAKTAGELLKWTLGSLLAVNGGALVALIGSDELRTAAFHDAALLFGGGMIAALMGGAAMAFSFGLVSSEQQKRAFNSKPIPGTALNKFKLEKATDRWLGAAVILWIVSFGLFATGCISTAYLPHSAAMDRLNADTRDAMARLKIESDTFGQLVADPHSTAEERRAANDRVRAASIDVRIRLDRARRELDLPDNWLDEELNTATTTNSH